MPEGKELAGASLRLMPEKVSVKKNLTILKFEQPCWEELPEQASH